MAELAEDVESLPPCVTRGIDVSVAVVDIAKVGERLRLAFGLADVPVQVADLLITGNGLVPVAEVAVDVGDAVHGVCGAHGVVQFLKHREGLLAPGQGPPVVTELGMKPADAVEHACLAHPLPGCLVMVVRVLGVPQ